MLVLLVGVVFGIASGYFATQNFTPVTIRVAEYVFQDIPLYLVIMGSLFVGFFSSWVLYGAKSVSSRVIICGKDHVVRRARQSAPDLELRVRELESENARLRTNPASQFESHHRALA